MSLFPNILVCLCLLGLHTACSDDGPRNYRRYTTCAFADVDADGDSDLFLGQIAGATQGIDVPSDSDDLLLNDGSGNF